MDDAVNKLRRAAPDSAFLGSLNEMAERWEKLNKMLRDEFKETGEDIRFYPSSHDGRLA